MTLIDLRLGDCEQVMLELEDDSIDAIVTDPPYGINFMNKGWDNQVPGVSVWAQCLRVLKPGGHLLAFAGTRTQHRMASNIEDAGFEIRDMIAWIYGSGFPKSLNISKAIDRAAGAEREVVGTSDTRGAYDGVDRGVVVHKYEREKGGYSSISNSGPTDLTAPATPEAAQWDGWGTALKPALEPITVARKPFTGTVAGNVLKYGTGGLNIDGTRIAGKLEGDPNRFAKTDGGSFVAKLDKNDPVVRSEGRWPANLIHDGTAEATGGMPETTRAPTAGGTATAATGGVYGEYQTPAHPGDTGSASRYYYAAKTSKEDRNAGNNHPTVKPTELMKWLCTLITPPGGTILDPFLGSGSTGKAAHILGFDFVGIELDEHYLEIARQRIGYPDDSLFGDQT
tara:strand:- start:1285 stop:2472 length:1188 start_codon:yes stop_codon:yes gene_type:complete